jgi:hypothetical protein
VRKNEDKRSKEALLFTLQCYKTFLEKGMGQALADNESKTTATETELAAVSDDLHAVFD